jgi:SHS2 domain-containing protein
MRIAKFRYLPHTADIKFVAYGRDLKQLIENSALALLSVMLDVKKIGARKESAKAIEITEEAGTRENLVWFTLQDILAKVDEGKLCAFEFKVKSTVEGEKGFSVSGALRFKGKDASCFLTEVKAVTPSGLEVKRTKKGLEVEVVLDV